MADYDQEYDDYQGGAGYYGHYPNIDANDLYDEDGGYSNLAGMHAAQMKSRPQPLMNNNHDDGLEDEDDDHNHELLEKLDAYHYKPDMFDNSGIPSMLQPFLDLITDHIPDELSLPLRLRPFIPDYIPSVGEPDVFIKVGRPDNKPELAGLTFVDEPCLAQSDPTVLELRLRRSTRKAGLGEGNVRAIADADKNNMKITSWLNEMKKATVDRSMASQVTYSKPMPALEDLVKIWPAEFEAVLETIGLPHEDIDLDVEELSRVVCALLDIPVHENIIESLHLLVSLYLECSQNSQLGIDKDH